MDESRRKNHEFNFYISNRVFFFLKSCYSDCGSLLLGCTMFIVIFIQDTYQNQDNPKHTAKVTRRTKSPATDDTAPHRTSMSASSIQDYMQRHGD